MTANSSPQVALVRPRRQVARLASGKLVYEPKVTIASCGDDTMSEMWGIRVNGHLAGRIAYRNRADALAAARKIARHLASGKRIPTDAF